MQLSFNKNWNLPETGKEMSETFYVPEGISDALKKIKDHLLGKFRDDDMHARLQWKLQDASHGREDGVHP